MIRPQDLLHPRPEGLYCPPADLYIDPVRAVDRAVITHGHADHARAGHGAVAATPQTIALMEVRYGRRFAGAVEALNYGQTIRRNGVDIELAPAGHVLGSAQVVLRWRGLTITASGDFKRAFDPTCARFEPVLSDVFITEATFGLPAFHHPRASDEIARLLASLSQFPDRAHLVGAYSLGKAQRVIRLLRDVGYDRLIHVHNSLAGINAVYERFGVQLGALETLPAGGAKDLDRRFSGAIIVGPPSCFSTTWAAQFPDPLYAFASGWMRVRARARQSGSELPLIISDHADWDELTATAMELASGELWITHGRADALTRWGGLNGVSARALSMVGYGEDGEPAA